MDGDQSGKSEPADKGSPPKRRPTIIRVFSAIKRYENRRNRRAKQEKSDRDLIMARWTRRVGIFTAGLVGVSIITGVIFWRQLGVMQGQLGAMEDDQRAWVSADISINGDLKVTESGAVVVLKYVLKNDGRTPAVNVSMSASVKVVVVPKGQYIVPDDALSIRHINDLEVLKRHCETYAAVAEYASGTIGGGFFGNTIFPGKTSEIADHLAGIEFISEIDRRVMTPDAVLTDEAPVLVSCIAYRTGSNGQFHQTGDVFWLERVNPENGTIDFLTPGKIPKDDLILVPVARGAYAN